MRFYQILLKHFGAQGWWPVSSQGSLKPQYHPGRFDPLSESQKMEVCIGAILTQNTSWKNVEKALVNLLARTTISAKSILKIPVGRLGQMIRSSGYFRQKAIKLRFFCDYLSREYDGDVGRLLDRPLKQSRKKLLEINGIGPETADSILLYAGRKPIFVVDAYTRRIGLRMRLFETDKYDDVQKYFMKRLPLSIRLFNEFHALLVSLGKDFCRTRPMCSICPVLSLCPTGQRSS